MSLKKASAYAAALAITTTLAISQASALTFASFGVTGGTRFSLTSDSFSATETGNFSVANAVTLPASLGGSVFAATLTLTGALAPGTGNESTFPGASNSNLSQSLSSLSFTITGASGAVAGKNLLSGALLIPSGNTLSANVNNTSATSTASIGVSGSDATIGFSSDILAFQVGSRDATFTLNNISPSVLSVKGTPIAGGILISNGDIQDFLADVSANFSATPTPTGVGAAVPEPGAFALLSGMGVSGLTFGLRARRRK